MKGIKNFLVESNKGFDINWVNSDEYKWSPKAEWLSINVNEGVYDWIEPDEVKSWDKDGMDPEDSKKMFELKPGEMFTPDGWNYYFRIKK